jgi:endo-1,4-beta-xylanase
MEDPMENRSSIWARYWIAALALLLTANSWAQLANGQTKFLGNVINSSVPGNFSQLWNQVTPENAGKWGSVESTRNQMNWSQLDAIYTFAQRNGFKVKGHTLVWGSQFPQWLSGLSPAQQRAEIEEWMQAYAARYPNTWAIDVVNEPIKTPLPWKAALGGDGATGWDWVITSFQLARQYLPNTLLFINEYGTENDPPARARYLTIINLLKDRGLLDGIGVQSHYFNLDNMSASQMTSALNDYAATGLDVYISELDITGGSSSEAAQAAKYQELFPVIWNHPSVKGVTLWGYIVGQTWRENTGIVNGNGTGRQAMTWLESFLQPTQNTLSVAPGTVSFAATAASSFVAVTSNLGWNVTANASWLTASPASGSNNGNFTLSATANTGAARAGIVTVTAGNLARTIDVTQSGTTPLGDYSISAPATLSINRSASASATISIARTGGFGGSVTLSATGLPSGVTVNFSPSPTTTNTSVLTLTASSAAMLGAGTVMITATSGTSSRTIPIALTVSEAAGGDLVTVTSAVTSASAWFNEQQLRVSHTSPLTALSVTVVIQRTNGLSASGQYNTVGGQIAQSSSTTSSTLTYQFTLAAGQTLGAANNRVFAVQMGGTGTAHPTTGDTYTVTYTSGGQSFTRTGTF